MRNRCQTWDKTKATYKNSKIGDKVVDLMFEKTFFCVKSTLFQPSGSSFFGFFLYAWNSLRIKVTYTSKILGVKGGRCPLTISASAPAVSSWIVPKNTVKLINSNKNKLNNEIFLFFFKEEDSSGFILPKVKTNSLLKSLPTE